MHIGHIRDYQHELMNPTFINEEHVSKPKIQRVPPMFAEPVMFRDMGGPSIKVCSAESPRRLRMHMGHNRDYQHELMNPTFINEEHVSKPKIQSVPHMLCQKHDFLNYYDLVILAIGPIHHRNYLVQQTEKLKLRLAHHFIKENALDNEDLYNKIMINMENFKQCYDKEVIEEYKDDELTFIFLVDGCAVLHFIYCLSEPDSKLKELNMKRDTIAFMLRDMFLLENQLPYQLLELLMSSIVGISTKGNLLMRLIKVFVAGYAGDTIAAPAQQSGQKEPCHLLDLLRDCLIIEPKKDKKSEKLTARRPCFAKESGEQEELKSGEIKYLINHTFRNVSELKASGIDFKASNTSSLKDVSFVPCCFFGTLKIPRFQVSDHTAPKFLNPVAYEMCPDFMNDLEVTSYICFLDSLIDNPEDVKELRKVNILHNLLGSDKDVAKLFNEISTGLVQNSSLYHDVKDEIEKIYNCKWKIWIAQGLHDHFSSPWSILAFIGAILALVFSLVQMLYAINPKK